MATLSIQQLAQLAANVGIPNGQPMYDCVSIALAESGGRTDATNTANDNGTIDRGLWQINSVHDDKMPGADRFDPNVNAQLMAQISSGGSNWQPWSTYNNGAYLEHAQRVMGELGGTQFTPGEGVNVPGGFGSGAGNGLTVTNAALVTQAQQVSLDIGGTTEAISKFFHLLTTAEGWLRILKAGIGVMTVVMGAFLLFSSSKAGKTSIKTAVSVATKGAL
ncbi:putative entry lysozyme [Rhodococcus phage Toil]|uniref:Putative entry lysozyme n=1 Tax=Rhodococcus phage Toil TaxID=1975614 RepID=A0A1W6DXX2_9VIRU|nr:putative entry lysozyme [Rhodococcus phage Toil]ARK07706.1 putative entry lysozyme [Rhodococcus phage Toil]